MIGPRNRSLRVPHRGVVGAGLAAALATAQARDGLRLERVVVEGGRAGARPATSSAPCAAPTTGSGAPPQGAGVDDRQWALGLSVTL